jgi:hypothetical protein
MDNLGLCINVWCAAAIIATGNFNKWVCVIVAVILALSRFIP